MRLDDRELSTAPQARAPLAPERPAAADVALRLTNWPERLLAVAAAHNGAFKWGERDCATLFSGAVLAVTGRDPLAPYRPWRSQQDAMRRLAASGYASVCALVEDEFDEIQPADARRGDLVYAESIEPLTCPAVIIGSLAMSLAPDGPVLFPRTLARRAFLVGR